jgi:hypothetical protein
MARVELSSGALVVHVEGSDRIWALKSRLEVPLEHVSGARLAGEEERGVYKGARFPGTNVPGVITAGSFHQRDEWVFWDVHHIERAIVISTRDEKYARLVIEVDDPAATVAAIEAALAAR